MIKHGENASGRVRSRPEHHAPTSRNKNELPAARIHRQCNPKAVEVAFTGVANTIPRPWIRHCLMDALVHNYENLLPKTFFLMDMWIFGMMKSTRVARTPLCRYQLGMAWRGKGRVTPTTSADPTSRQNRTIAGSKKLPCPMQQIWMDMC